MELTFLAYSQVDAACYDRSQLKMCTMKGKTYWVGEYSKHSEVAYEQVCLQYGRTFCFVRDERGIDPKSRMKQIAQELRKQESEARKKSTKQEMLKALSEQYEQLELCRLGPTHHK